MSTLPDKYRQVVAAQADSYADIRGLIHAAELCNKYAVSDSPFICLLAVCLLTVAQQSASLFAARIIIPV